MNGRFIALEGGEGAGKSTLLQLLFEKLQCCSGLDLLMTREPGGTAFAEEVRALLLFAKGEQLTAMSELFLILAARADHVEKVIKPALLSGKVVLCDRFTESTMAYQGQGRGLDISQVERCCLFATGGCEPSLTLLLDIDPEVSHQRLKQDRIAVDRMEMELMPFHRRVRQGFLAQARRAPERIVIIDAAAAQDVVVRQAFDAIAAHLGC